MNLNHSHRHSQSGAAYPITCISISLIFHTPITGLVPLTSFLVSSSAKSMAMHVKLLWWDRQFSLISLEMSFYVDSDDETQLSVGNRLEQIWSQNEKVERKQECVLEGRCSIVMYCRVSQKLQWKPCFQSSISPADNNAQRYITGIKYSEAQYIQVSLGYLHSLRSIQCTLHRK